MHITIGAALLILGVLFLATSKAGLKVLGVLALVGCVGVGFIFYASNQEDHARFANCVAKKAAAAHTGQGYIPFDPNCPDPRP
jgi:hypothetical protein